MCSNSTSSNNNSTNSNSSGASNESVFEYFCPLTQIPRIKASDTTLLWDFLSREQPVIIEESHLVQPAVIKWDLPYLREHMGSKGKYNVMETDSRQRFTFHDIKKAGSLGKDKFLSNVKLHDNTFQQFLDKLSASQSSRLEDRKYFYLQQPLTDTVGENIFTDFRQFNWQFINTISARNNWGALTNNMLLIGQAGNITPVHFDEQQNIFTQVHGKKRFILFSPDNLSRLYPYPVYHPRDRQSQVDLRNPDFIKYPRLAQLTGCEGTVSPGDIIYIPIYWWHQVDSLHATPHTTSITFWYKTATSSHPQISNPVTPQQKIAITRNIEKMLEQVISDPSDIADILCTMVDGRYYRP